MWAADIFSLLFHQWYLDDTGIKVHHQSDRIKMGKNIRQALENEPINVQLNKGGLFEKEYYGVTMNTYSEYLYYGKTKDNRPNGFGVLTTSRINPEEIETLEYLVYAGSFKEGRYDGYGALFAQQADALSYGNTIMSTFARLYQDGQLEDPTFIRALAYLCSYVEADGDWSKGEKNGKVNEFKVWLEYLPEEDFWGGCCYPELYVTNIQKGNQEGDTKHYIDDILLYDGEMKAHCASGKGISYYRNGQKQYDGEWKGGRYNGTGTLYDENGTKIYKGQWKNGDYAS